MEIEGQHVGRIPNPDVCDLVNTMQKIAQKRAFVGATLLGVNASEFFTQDIEDMVVDAFDGEDRSPAPAHRKAPSQAPRHTAQASQSNGKFPEEEEAPDNALLAHCAKEKGEKNAQAFFNAMYSKKSLEEKRQAVKTLGLAVAPPAAPAPQPVTPSNQDVVEGELVEESSPEPSLSPARLEIEDLSNKLRELGCAPDEVNAKISRITSGVYAIDEIAEEHLPKVRQMLSRYVEMGDQAAAEIAKEFKSKEKK